MKINDISFLLSFSKVFYDRHISKYQRIIDDILHSIMLSLLSLNSIFDLYDWRYILTSYFNIVIDSKVEFCFCKQKNTKIEIGMRHGCKIID